MGVNFGEGRGREGIRGFRAGKREGEKEEERVGIAISISIMKCTIYSETGMF